MIHSGNLLQLWFSNLYTIIDVLIFASLALIFLVAVFSFRETKKLETGEKLSDLEDTLRRVLESTEVKASSVSVSAGAVTGKSNVDLSSADLPADAVEQLGQLKTELQEKELEVVGLRDKLNSLEASGGVNSETEAKLKDLEAKLQEYEIIEDDIANLSLYKQENAKLKQEIEKLKANVGSAVAASAEAAAPAAVPAEPMEAEKSPAPSTPEAAEQNSVAAADGADDDIMAEFAAAVNEQKSGSSKPEEPAQESAETDDDIMAEFAAAVNEQKSGVIEESSAEPAPAEKAEELDDVMAEFSAAVNEQKAVESGEVAGAVPEETKEEVNAAAPEDDIMAEFAAAVNEQKTSEAGEQEGTAVVAEAIEEKAQEDHEEESIGFEAVSNVDDADADIMGEFSEESVMESPESAPVEASASNDESEGIDLSSLIDDSDKMSSPEPEVEEVETAKPSLEVVEEEAVVEELSQEASETNSADDLIDESTFEQFNKAMLEQREARKVKEEEIAAKVAELGIGVDVKETVTEEDMKKFREALGVSEEEENSSASVSETSFLENEMDTDKILDEVSELQSVNIEAESGEEEDPGAQLIAEFENFAQKN